MRLRTGLWIKLQVEAARGVTVARSWRHPPKAQFSRKHAAALLAQSLSASRIPHGMHSAERGLSRKVFYQALLIAAGCVLAMNVMYEGLLNSQPWFEAGRHSGDHRGLRAGSALKVASKLEV